jgi:CBS domain-containing protein/predicted CoA-binding protein
MLPEETNSFRLRRQRKEILETARRVAVVGLRPDPIYKSYALTRKLIEYGLDITPVISNCESILGCTRYGRVADIPEPIDIVQFYTDGKADMMQAARDAIQKRAKAFWIENDEASDEIRGLLKDTGICLVEYESLQKEYEQHRTVCTTPPAYSSGAQPRYVGERMTRYPITVTPQSSIESALEKMKKGHFRHLPVVDEHNRLLGMFSDRDLRLFQPSPTLEANEVALAQFCATPVGKVATLNPVSITPDATMEEAAKLMLHWKVESLPVIAGDAHVVGIITSSDFLKEGSARSEPKHKQH